PADFHSPCSLYCSLPPPDLHSFPTRRSSDLEVVGRVTHGRAGDPSGHVVPAGGPSRRMSLPIPAVAVETGQVDASHECDSVIDEDRKSTRLNSSHVSISYAVFCLKKKKEYTL